MRYYADCEFNGLGGELLSLALVSEKGDYFYAALTPTEAPTDFVQEFVNPRLFVGLTRHYELESRAQAQKRLLGFLHAKGGVHANPHITVDWPDDIAYLSQLLITGPGTMVELNSVQFELKRVDAWDGEFYVKALRHNALYDALTLQQYLKHWVCPSMERERARSRASLAFNGPYG